MVYSTSDGVLLKNGSTNKAEEIQAILSEPQVDLWRLRELALTEGGLINDTLRRRAWPLLLGLHDQWEADAASATEESSNLQQPDISCSQIQEEQLVSSGVDSVAAEEEEQVKNPLDASDCIPASSNPSRSNGENDTLDAERSSLKAGLYDSGNTLVQHDEKASPLAVKDDGNQQLFITSPVDTAIEKSHSQQGFSTPERFKSPDSPHGPCDEILSKSSGNTKNDVETTNEEDSKRLGIHDVAFSSPSGQCGLLSALGGAPSVGTSGNDKDGVMKLDVQDQSEPNFLNYAMDGRANVLGENAFEGTQGNTKPVLSDDVLGPKPKIMEGDEHGHGGLRDRDGKDVNAVLSEGGDCNGGNSGRLVSVEHCDSDGVGRQSETEISVLNSRQPLDDSDGPTEAHEELDKIGELPLTTKTYLNGGSNTPSPLRAFLAEHSSPEMLWTDESSLSSTLSMTSSNSIRRKRNNSVIVRSLDSMQIDLDVARCTWHLLTGNQRTRRLQMEHKRNRKMARLIRRKQRRLANLLNYALVHSYHITEPDYVLRYYQGYHDVACIFLAALGGSVGSYPADEGKPLESMAAAMGIHLPAKALVQVSQSHLRDFLKDNFKDLQTVLRLTVYPLLALFDPEVHEHLYASEMEPSFALSWIITWFAHEIRDTELVKRIFDFLIVSHPIMPIYLSIAMVIHPTNRKEVLVTDCDFAVVHQTLRGLPKNSSMVGWKYRPGDGYVSDDEEEEEDDHLLDPATIDGDFSRIQSELQLDAADVPPGTQSSVSTCGGSASESHARVPFQELIDLSVTLMMRMPPRSLLKLAKKYYGNDQVLEMLGETEYIAMFGQPPIWMSFPFSSHEILTKLMETDPSCGDSAVALGKYILSEEDEEIIRSVLLEKKTTPSVVALGYGFSQGERRRTRKRKLVLAVLFVLTVLLTVWLGLICLPLLPKLSLPSPGRYVAPTERRDRLNMEDLRPPLSPTTPIHVALESTHTVSVAPPVRKPKPSVQLKTKPAARKVSKHHEVRGKRSAETVEPIGLSTPKKRKSPRESVSIGDGLAEETESSLGSIGVVPDWLLEQGAAGLGRIQKTWGATLFSLEKWKTPSTEGHEVMAAKQPRRRPIRVPKWLPLPRLVRANVQRELSRAARVLAVGHDRIVNEWNHTKEVAIHFCGHGIDQLMKSPFVEHIGNIVRELPSSVPVRNVNKAVHEIPALRSKLSSAVKKSVDFFNRPFRDVSEGIVTWLNKPIGAYTNAED